MAADQPRTVVLVAGPEVTDPEVWANNLNRIAPGARLVTTAADVATIATQRSTTVVPLTTGRHPQMIADTARALRWARDNGGADCRLAPPLGDATQVIAALRGNIRTHAPDRSTAVIVESTALDPFSDAELFRLARLAWQYGANPVEVAFDGAWPSSAEVTNRLHTLGAQHVVYLRADLTLQPRHSIALWRPAALQALIAARVHSADHAADGHGDDGIDGAILADHDHGYAHSHGDSAHNHHHGHHHGHHHH